MWRVSLDSNLSSKLKPGDIGFIMHRDSWLSKAIAWFMGPSFTKPSRWSHTFMVLDPDEDRVYLSETSSFEVWIGDLTTYLKNPNAEFEIYTPKLLSDAQRKQVALKAHENFGEVYGYLQLLSLGIRCILKKMHIRIPNFIKAGIVCSHNVVYGYQSTDIPEISGIDPESLDTEDLYQIVLRQKYHFEKVMEKKYG